MLIHAAAGGVGLKAVEYVHWLRASTTATAGGRHKHLQLGWLGVNALCSSRDGIAFCCGLMAQHSGTRLHAVLNSLSLDFISASFAVIGERGTFHEIGKRAIWAYPRHKAAASHAAYGAIAVDTDTANGPDWMHGLLCRLAKRADAGVLTHLPLRSFDMEMQVELAFRTLQSGLNTGKIVIRVASRDNRARQGSHVITGLSLIHI